MGIVVRVAPYQPSWWEWLLRALRLREPEWLRLARQDGSRERPFESIQDAIDDASARYESRTSVSVNVAPGIYSESIHLNRPNTVITGGSRLAEWGYNTCYPEERES